MAGAVGVLLVQLVSTCQSVLAVCSADALVPAREQDPCGHSEVVSCVGRFGHKGVPAIVESGSLLGAQSGSVRVTPAWATIPRTGGPQPKNWTGALLFNRRPLVRGLCCIPLLR